jgi:hypothetical protein
LFSYLRPDTLIFSCLLTSSLTSSSTLSYTTTETSSFSLLDSFSLPQSTINMLSLLRSISHYTSFPLTLTSSCVPSTFKLVLRTASSTSLRFNSQATSFPLVMSRTYTLLNLASFPLVIAITVAYSNTSLRSPSYLQATSRSRTSSNSLSFSFSLA